MASVTLAGISKDFGSTSVLRDIHLHIEDKSFVVFVGPSGCGKSTLLRIIAGLESPSSGILRINAQDMTTQEPVDRGIAMVFQSYALYPHMSVYENIAYPLRTARLSREVIDHKVRAAASSLQLNEHLERKPGQLSGGQRQRVAIGRSIVRDPGVFLFDEPLSNLDASLRSEMRGELMRLRRQLDTTMIYVTHDQVEAMTMADKIVVLNKGRIEQIGSPMELYNNPKTRFVGSFIGQPSMNFVPFKAVHKTSETVSFSFQSGCKLTFPTDENSDEHFDSSQEIGVRPEHIRLVPSGSGLTFKVDYVEKLGATTLVHGTTEGQRVCVSCNADNTLNIVEGASFGLQLDIIHVFAFSGERIAHLTNAL